MRDRTSKLASLILGLILMQPGLSLTAAAQNSMPSPEPQVAPPTQSIPDTQPQDGGQGQGTPAIDELQLTQDQKEKIAALVDDENKQIAAVREDTSLTLEQKQQKALQIQQAAVPKIKAVLTPEQLQKLGVIVQERERQQQNAPQALPPMPQQP